MGKCKVLFARLLKQEDPDLPPFVNVAENHGRTLKEIFSQID